MLRCLLPLALVLAAGRGQAQAQPLVLRICTNQIAQLPYITPEGEGMADRLIQQAAREAGMTVEYRAAPVARCREEIRLNLFDAYPTVPYTPSLVPVVAYPMEGGAPDPARAVLSMRIMVFRRVGTKVDWDGSRFANLSSKVLVQSAASVPQDRLRAMGVPFDPAAKTMRANFDKLLAGRGEVLITIDPGLALITLPEFAGRIEALPIPFSTEVNYLGLSHGFVERHPKEAERLWAAIARIRATPAYQAEARRIIEKLARPPQP